MARRPGFWDHVEAAEQAEWRRSRRLKRVLPGSGTHTYTVLHHNHWYIPGVRVTVRKHTA